MLLKYPIAIMFLMTSSLLIAQLPKEIVVSCHEGETPNDSVSYMYLPGNLWLLASISKIPTNSSISYISIPGSFDYKKIKGSEERYEFDANVRHFSIEDNQYFVRDNS